MFPSLPDTRTADDVTNPTRTDGASRPRRSPAEGRWITGASVSPVVRRSSRVRAAQGQSANGTSPGRGVCGFRRAGGCRVARLELAVICKLHYRRTEDGPGFTGGAGQSHLDRISSAPPRIVHRTLQATFKPTRQADFGAPHPEIDPCQRQLGHHDASGIPGVTPLRGPICPGLLDYTHYCPKKIAVCSHNTLFYIFKKAERGCHRLEPREPLRPCFLLHAQGGAICIPVNSFFPR